MVSQCDAYSIDAEEIPSKLAQTKSMLRAKCFAASSRAPQHIPFGVSLDCVYIVYYGLYRNILPYYWCEIVVVYDTEHSFGSSNFSGVFLLGKEARGAVFGLCFGSTNISSHARTLRRSHCARSQLRPRNVRISCDISTSILLRLTATHNFSTILRTHCTPMQLFKPTEPIDLQ